MKRAELGLLEDSGFSRIWNFFQFGDTEEIFLSGT